MHENDVPLTRHPLQYGHERARAPYLLTRVRRCRSSPRSRARGRWWPDAVRSVVRFRDGKLPVPGSPRVVFTPGHTLGHCALHLPDRDAVIAGDAVVTLDPYTGKTGPRIVARAATAVD